MFKLVINKIIKYYKDVLTFLGIIVILTLATHILLG